MLAAVKQDDPKLNIQARCEDTFWLDLASTADQAPRGTYHPAEDFREMIRLFHQQQANNLIPGWSPLSASELAEQASVRMEPIEKSGGHERSVIRCLFGS